LESKLRGIENDKTLTHQIVDPVYSLSRTQSNKLGYAVVLITMIISAWMISSDKHALEKLRLYENYDL
jgi:hypothetical protein